MILRQLLKTQCWHRQGLLHSPNDGRVYRLTGRCSRIFDAGCEFRTLENLSRQRRSIWNGVYLALQTTLVHLYAVCTEKCHWNVATLYGRHTCEGEMTIRPRLPRLHYHIFEIPDGTLGHVCQVLQLLSDCEVTLKLKKCSFVTDTVDYLRYIIRPGNLEVATQTSDAIRDFKEPCNVAELSSFLDLCSAFRQSIPTFARITNQLNKKLCENQPQTFDNLTDDERTAMRTLKKRLISPPILSLTHAKGR